MGVPSNPPIVDSLRSRILRGLQVGTLQHGDRLSSARELAAEFDTDYRQVLSAFKTLEAEGLIQVRERGGAYVTSENGPGDRSTVVPTVWLAEILIDAYARELSPMELCEWLARSIETVQLRALVVAMSDAEVAELTREISDDFGISAQGVLVSTLAAQVKSSAVWRSDLLLMTPHAHEELQRIGAVIDKPIIIVETRTTFSDSDWRGLLRQSLWVVVATAEFGELLRASLSSVEGHENLRIVVAGVDDLASIPKNAPTFATHRVRHYLQNGEFRGRLLPSPRTLTAESARNIITFVVQTNLRAARAIRQAQELRERPLR